MELHGGNIYKIARQYNLKEEEIIDFSSNINPFGVSDRLKNAITKNLDAMIYYPDPNYKRLRSILADYHCISEDSIVPGNGATELIYLFSRTFKPATALVVAPTFSEYQRALQSVNCAINFFKLPEIEQFQLNIGKLEIEIKKNHDLIIICNPNNPTSRFTELDKIEEICFYALKSGSWILLDESFIEMINNSRDNSALRLGKRYKNIFILRSMTKFFAIPGLRFGYAVCFNKNFNIKIMHSKEPWTVNVFAELAAEIMLPDAGYREKTLKLIHSEKKYLCNNLLKIPWLKIFKPDANYILIKILSGFTSAGLQAGLLKDKILIRDASNFRYLNSKFVRLAVKNRADNRYLIDALKKMHYSS